MGERLARMETLLHLSKSENSKISPPKPSDGQVMQGSNPSQTPKKMYQRLESEGFEGSVSSNSLHYETFGHDNSPLALENRWSLGATDWQSNSFSPNTQITPTSAFPQVVVGSYEDPSSLDESHWEYHGELTL